MVTSGAAGLCGHAPFPISRRRDRGISMVEIMIALVVIAVALLALVSLMTSAGSIQDDSRERTLAYNAARQKIEEMRNLTELATIYTTYNSAQTANRFRVDDIPVGRGPMRPSTTTPTLPQIPAQGQIFFPEETPGAGIKEDLTTNGILKKQFSLPKDLNQSGAIDAGVIPAANLTLLPVMVRIEWRTAGGKFSQVEVVTYITKKY